MIAASPSLVLTGCETSEPACRAMSSEVVVRDPAPDETPDPVLLREDGVGLVASWIHRVVVITDAGEVFPSTTGFTFASLTASGELGSARSVAAPERLAARRSASDVGAVAVGEGTLVHWIERAQHTDDTGKLETTTELVTTIIDGDGTVRELALPDATCDDCNLRVSAASLGDRVLVAYIAEAPIGGPVGRLEAPRPPHGLLLDAEGGIVAELDLAGLGILGWVALETTGPFIAVRAAAATWLVDPESATVRGPMPHPPIASSALGVDAAGERVWRAVTQGQAGVGESELTLILQAFDPDGRVLTRAERLSTASTSASSVAATASGVAVVFDADGETYLARADHEGRKRGGDSPLGAAASIHRLRAVHNGELVDVHTTADDVSRREIACDP
jgi:hypothetical protein